MQWPVIPAPGLLTVVSLISVHDGTRISICPDLSGYHSHPGTFFFDEVCPALICNGYYSRQQPFDTHTHQGILIRVHVYVCAEPTVSRARVRRGWRYGFGAGGLVVLRLPL